MKCPILLVLISVTLKAFVVVKDVSSSWSGCSKIPLVFSLHEKFIPPLQIAKILEFFRKYKTYDSLKYIDSLKSDKCYMELLSKNL